MPDIIGKWTKGNILDIMFGFSANIIYIAFRFTGGASWHTKEVYWSRYTIHCVLNNNIIIFNNICK